MSNPKQLTSPLSRREFLLGSSAFALSLAAYSAPLLSSKRILVGTGTEDGILSYAWDATAGSLTPEGLAAPISHSTWLELSPDRRFLYVACELEEFQGKPTGAVASFSLIDGKLTPVSQVSSTGKGTCHLTTGRTGRVVICANYTGGSAASFLSTDGKLSQAVWSEKYSGYKDRGPVAGRQEAAHAHFASVSPDNRFAYINDLGSDKIHIYKLDATTGVLTPAGTFAAHAGAGPRTLHFGREGTVAYSVNELDSTVDVLRWNPLDGSLKPIQQVSLSPRTTEADGSQITNTACDTVLTRDGRFAYFANRGDNFLLAFHIDPATGKLSEFKTGARTESGGKTPRNFRLDPTERWMLVANQTSSNIGIFARNPKTGQLASQGKSVPATIPMCIVFV